MKKSLTFWITLLAFISILALTCIEIIRLYLLMPFPGSQTLEGSLDTAYKLHTSLPRLRIVIGTIIVGSSLFAIWRAKLIAKVGIGISLMLYMLIFYVANYKFAADQLFLPPTQKVFGNMLYNDVPKDKVVIGIAKGREAKAYPLEMMAYHHQVEDTLGGEPVIITYCSVCRTARAFSPMIDGKKERFSVIGMNRFNAMFEDKSTGSWWHQATGEAVAGPRKGTQLEEILAKQMTLSAWLEGHPFSQILQLDTVFQARYDHYDGYDRGLLTNALELTDSSAWQDKSWVIGIEGEDWARSYDYLELRDKGLIQDEPSDTPLLIVLEKDSVSFYVWERRVDQMVLDFAMNDSLGRLIDTQTTSQWNTHGVCVEGELKGKQLKPKQAYLEYWHSWRTFRPHTDQYIPQ